MTPASAASTTSRETPSSTATSLKEFSHALKPSALLPHSSARADAAPRMTAIAAAKVRALKSFPRIASFIAADLWPRPFGRAYTQPASLHQHSDPNHHSGQRAIRRLQHSHIFRGALRARPLHRPIDGPPPPRFSAGEEKPRRRYPPPCSEAERGGGPCAAWWRGSRAKSNRFCKW